MSDLLLFVTVTLITCATPGAGVLNTIANAFRYGWPRAWICPRQRRGRGRHVGRFCRRALSRYCRHTGRVLRPADDRCLGSGMDGHKKLEGTGRRPGVSGGSARRRLFRENKARAVS